MAISVESPKKSPSLDELGSAFITDESGNRIPVVVLVYPNAAGQTGLGVLPVNKQVSQVTGLEQAPQVVVGSGMKAPVMAAINVAGGLAVPSSGSKKFASTVQTATGSAQNVAHGLGVVPSAVLISPYDNTAAGSDPFAFAIAEGSHTSTNVVVTATAGLKFKVLAFA